MPPKKAPEEPNYDKNADELDRTLKREIVNLLIDHDTNHAIEYALFAEEDLPLDRQHEICQKIRISYESLGWAVALSFYTNGGHPMCCFRLFPLEF